MIVIVLKLTSSSGAHLSVTNGAFIRCAEDFLHSSNVSTDEADFDAMRMKRGFRKEISNDASGQFAGGLILPSK